MKRCGSMMMIETGESRGLRIALYISTVLLLFAAPAFDIAVLTQRSLQPFNIPALWMAVTVISLGALAALLLLMRKAPERAVRTLAASIILSAFFAGWAMPRLNPYIGYCDMCRSAMSMSKAHGKAQIVAAGIKHAANTDAFLGYSPAEVAADSIARLHGVVVMMPAKDAAGAMLSDKQDVGPMVIGYRE